MRRVGRLFLMVAQMRSFLTSSYRCAIMFRREMILWWFVIWLARCSSWCLSRFVASPMIDNSRSTADRSILFYS